mmetsp:Transcript_3493/g.4302  ORF Transcript_3493/g.4302 Transcript_3493/m.4302 type:complete len:276 (+) Transcript_3493:51-878(+)|eukprot:CAMPEP_0203654854 /NCGR_PEP_ID=MMETSP0088-20131115/36541_1 /ASSEMBLY_ACC=CAM_ASM_001087 /TAXON_ID=426623 /ORGANISM="Chaetoceros affinis, Strain CCMP159" /LENGTH=275 /DNA_ID=CAMNT_0050515277 /DNA_START=45 /DNA_END=872 /DNA_ORIENTATION=+
MTTAHRPTWKAAVGKAQEGGYTTGGGAPSAQRSILDAPAHTKLKVRNDRYALESKSTQRDAILKKSLEKLRSMEAKSEAMKRNLICGPRKIDEKVEEEGRRKLLMSENDVDESKLKSKYDDADVDDDGGNGGNGNDDGWSDVEDVVNAESDLDASDSDTDDESDDESDEDEEDLLQAELAKIRAEREKAKAKIAAEEAAEEQSRMEEAALIGNPLLNASASGSASAGSGKLKRRWNDDVVFRNQAKGEPDPNKKRFINDTVRNDFHKRFLNKFIR